MKKLEFNDADLLIWMASMKMPVSSTFYNETIEKFPKRFPKEYAHKKKYESIPQNVHDEYFEELHEFKEKLWENEPKSAGIMSMINADENYKKWNEAYERLKPLEEKKEKELYKKHYAKFLD